VVDWLSNFTDWVPYKHKVKALLANGKLVTLPVNHETALIVGKDKIVDTFFRPYTQKMWGLSIDEIDKAVLARVAIRDDMNEDYFPNDIFQALPSKGYTELISNILKHPNIEVELNRAYIKGEEADYFHTFNSMPIDSYFDFEHGYLPYRSIKFHTSSVMIPQIFPVATVNFTHNEPCTRVTEWKNLPNSNKPEGITTITIEEPCDYIDNNFERFYPIKDQGGVNQKLYNRYQSQTPKNMTFIGRCGLYVYIDMHQAVSIALSMANKFIYDK
jgi:UDP-galactopyranose mutase